MKSPRLWTLLGILILIASVIAIPPTAQAAALSGQVLGSTSVKLSWVAKCYPSSAPSECLGYVTEDYEVLRKTSASTSYWETIDSVNNPAIMEYEFIGLWPGTTYQFKIVEKAGCFWGCSLYLESNVITLTMPPDTDGYGVGDSEDLDDDGDGVQDASDAFPLNATEWIDTDADGIGNTRDPDDDGDGVADTDDGCPLLAGDYLDSDGDRVCDNLDTDDDGDLVLDGADAFPVNSAEWTDLDGDGTGNNGDLDRDGDGVENANDRFPEDSEEWTDFDGDGLGDNRDPPPPVISVTTLLVSSLLSVLVAGLTAGLLVFFRVQLSDWLRRRREDKDG